MSKVIDQTYVDIDAVAKEIARLQSLQIYVGPAAPEDSNLARIAGANEFGAIIRPRRGKYLAIPAVEEAKGKSPRDFAGLSFVPNKNGGGRLVIGKGEGAMTMYIMARQIRIPQRAFMRNTADSKHAQKKIERIASDAIRRLFAGELTAKQAAEACGASLAASVRSTITNGVAPENSPLTLALKRGSLPLYDEGTLHKSISYEVV